MEEGNATRALSELVDIGEQVYFDNDVYFTTYAMHCVEDGYPAREHCALAMARLTRALQAQRIQTYVNLANRIICRIGVIVHKTNLQWLVLQFGVIDFKAKPAGSKYQI